MKQNPDPERIVSIGRSERASDSEDRNVKESKSLISQIK
jgi:hypothetical protein